MVYEKIYDAIEKMDYDTAHNFFMSMIIFPKIISTYQKKIAIYPFPENGYHKDNDPEQIRKKLVEKRNERINSLLKLIYSVTGQNIGLTYLRPTQERVEKYITFIQEFSFLVTNDDIRKIINQKVKNA